MLNIHELTQDLENRARSCQALSITSELYVEKRRLLAKGAGYQHAAELLREWAIRENIAIFPHNCSACVYLGHRNKHDLYFCPQGMVPTVLARFGPADSEYTSGFDSSLPTLQEAQRRAKDKGLWSIQTVTESAS